MRDEKKKERSKQGKEGKGGECKDREEERRGEGIINNMFVWVQATTARGWAHHIRNHTLTNQLMRFPTD